MVKSYQDQLFKLPYAGLLSEKALNWLNSGVVKTGEEKSCSSKQEKTTQSLVEAEVVEDKAKARKKERVHRSAAARIISSSFAIAWSIILLVVFNFLSQYIAFYAVRNGAWVAYPILTSGVNWWLPILNLALFCTIAGHIILLGYDRYILRELIGIVLNIFGILTVASLLWIFPFTFDSVPVPALALVAPFVVTIILIGIIVGLAIGTLVSLIKLIVNLIRGRTTYDTNPLV
jgi:hypothetical protein